MEDELNNLHYQYRKAKEEADNARTLSVAAEEANDKLQKQIEELTKQLNMYNVQKDNIKELRKEKEDCEEITEMLMKETREKIQIQKLLGKKEKEINVIRKNNDILEKEVIPAQFLDQISHVLEIQ